MKVANLVLKFGIYFKSYVHRAIFFSHIQLEVCEGVIIVIQQMTQVRTVRQNLNFTPKTKFREILVFGVQWTLSIVHRTNKISSIQVFKKEPGTSVNILIS